MVLRCGAERAEQGMGVQPVGEIRGGVFFFFFAN